MSLRHVAIAAFILPVLISSAEEVTSEELAAPGESPASVDQSNEITRPFSEKAFETDFKPVTIGDPLAQAQVDVLSKSMAMYSDLHNPSDANKLSCTLPHKSKGTIVGSRGAMRLVVFDAKTWKSACKNQKGVGGQPMAWVDEGDVRSVKDLNRDPYGDICEAYTYLENNVVPESQPEVRSTPCEVGSCFKDPILSAFADAKNISKAQKLEPCLAHDGPDRQGPYCSFDSMYSVATNCGTSKTGKTIRCSQGECEKRLGRMACTNSPWKEKNLRERFYTLVAYSKFSSNRFGVDHRALPCIAGVETGYLEPMAKNLMACGNPALHSYHGLGMITRTTLEHYLSPYINYKIESNTKEKVQLGPFRTVIPEFNKPSYYACPQKMHDALGSSAELQIELMAYTLANKVAMAGGKGTDNNTQYNSYMYYNANATADPENGVAHARNYADAVQACVKCMRKRLPDDTDFVKPKEDPVHCLSATARGGVTHPFRLKIDDQIEKVFNGSMKRYCGEGGS